MKSFIFCKTWESHLGQSLPKTTAHPQWIPSAWSFTAQTTHGSNSEIKRFLTYWNRISKVMNYSFILTMKAQVLCKIKFQKIWCQHVNHLMNTGSFATHRLPPVSLVFKPASSFLAWWILGQQTKTRCNLLDPWEPWIVVQNGRAMSQCVPKKRPVYSFCSLS